MGGEESRPTYKRDFFVDFPTRYKPLKNISDNFYGSGTLYLKNDKSVTVIQQNLVAHESSYQQWKPLQLEHPNLISCLGVSSQKDAEMCSDGQITKLYYPYYERSLANEIELKAGENFAEPQICSSQRFSAKKQPTSHRYQAPQHSHHPRRLAKGCPSWHLPQRYFRI